jgi:hypothetical protein
MLPAVAGLLIIVATLWEAFETIVLPRRVTRRFRFTRLFYRTTWLPWRAIGRRIARSNRRESFLSIFGPLSLLLLFAVWAALLIVGFGFLYFSVRTPNFAGLPLESCIYQSGLGFGFLALVLSYLPVIYQAFSRREVNIVLLDARAGSPPTAAELLRRHGSEGLHTLQQLLHDWERWSAQILESHVSYPVVAYFRSQHNNESWLGALTAILDTSALLISGLDDACARQARLTFAMCRHTVVDLAQVFQKKPLALGDRLPDGDLARLRAVVSQAGIKLRDTPASREKLLHLREMYEPYLHALAAHLAFELPPFILSKEIADNWKTSAWGRISSPGSRALADAPLDDHSD